MSTLSPTVSPHEVGLDAGRLERIARHFRAYVDDGRLPGWQIAVMRRGELAYSSSYGWQNIEQRTPIADDTIFRIYSMTKPITTVAAMMLWEEGAFELKDHVAKFIPSFAHQKVYRAGSHTAPQLEPVTEPMQLWHLMSHTSGLTYGFMLSHPVDAMYRAAGFEWGIPRDLDLAGVCDALAALPLLFQPGREWNYSMSTDVLGRVVEVVSGQTLDEFFRTRIFEPLTMNDTGFFTPEKDHPRLASLYGLNPADKKAVHLEAAGKAAYKPARALLGGGGLVSTTHDYLRFAEMVRRGGELDGVRLLSPRTVKYMASNHLPNNMDLSQFGRPLFSETTYDGVGFGLGFSVTIDPIKAKVPGSLGEHGWGGAASTTFSIDPVEEMSVVMMTQLMPSSSWPLRSQLKQLVHQALID